MSDNCDGGMLYEPIEYLPCPKCCTEEFLERQFQSVGEGIGSSERSSLSQWKRVCRFALKTNREKAEELLAGRFKVVTYLEETKDRKDLVEKQWAFEESQLAN